MVGTPELLGFLGQRGIPAAHITETESTTAMTIPYSKSTGRLVRHPCPAPLPPTGGTHPARTKDGPFMTSATVRTL